MRYFAFTCFLILLVSHRFNSFAQLSDGGIPPSFLLKKASENTGIPFKDMPAVDVAALRAEDQYNDEIKDQPWRFGKNLLVDYNFENSGSWMDIGNGSRIWRLGITSKAAVSINLTFNRYKLPEGSKFFVYSADREKILGAFTSRNNQEDGYFATSLIPGDSIIIEYYEPEWVSFSAELNLWRVTHGYRGIPEFSKAFGNAGPCNVNVACPEGESMRDQVRSVALMVSGGNGFCTGALINNVNSDGIPYFLSADHCYEQPGTLVFWFNWESETCDNPETSPEANTLSGAIDRARWTDSDFWLLELNQIPPKNYGVYYSGWNRKTPYSMQGRVYGIHHPSGDIKKISWSDNGVVVSALGGLPGSGGDFWRIESWSDGTTTERGSSGSPLFDSTGKIIGQLFGGDAACGNTLPDWYGRFGVSWTGGGTNATRLSNWLDPDNSGHVTIEGFDPEVGQFPIDGQMASIIEPYENYTDTGLIIPKLLIRNAGSQALTEALIKLWIDTLIYDTLAWNGNLEMGEKEAVTLEPIPTKFGLYQALAKIEVAGDQNPMNDSLKRMITILDCGSDTLPYHEGFDRNKALLCWDLITVVPEAGKVMRVDTGQKPFCLPTDQTHLIEFNSYDCPSGSEIRLQSRSFSTLILDSITLSFDWHHDQGYSPRNDKVTVQYSFDGDYWFDVQEILRYHDTISGWNRKNILMPDTVSDKPVVYFGFLFHSEYGNNCHMDSLLITATAIEEPYPEFNATPRIGVIDSTITFTDGSMNGPTQWSWYFGSGAKPEVQTGQGPHSIVYTTTGLKTVRLVVNGQYTRIKHDYILIESSPFLVPRNLAASVDENDVYLEWEMAQSLFKDNISLAEQSTAKATLIDFTIFRDGIALDTVPEHAYIDTSLLPGTYAYFVVANYIAPEGISEPSDTILAEVPVSVTTPELGTDIIVYPNPSKGELVVQTDVLYHLEIYNNFGAKIQDLLIDQPVMILDLSLHPPGIYILKFSNGNNILITKIIRE